MKNVFDEAILAALEPPEQPKKRRCCLLWFCIIFKTKKDSINEKEVQYFTVFSSPLYKKNTVPWKKEKLLRPNIKTKTCIHTTISSFLLNYKFPKKNCVVYFLPSKYEKQKNFPMFYYNSFETLLKVFLCHYPKIIMLKPIKRIPKNKKSPV